MIKNEEGYMDPTYAGAYKTIRQEEKRKQDEADAARMETAIHQAKAIFKEAGFEVIEQCEAVKGKFVRYITMCR